MKGVGKGHELCVKNEVKKEGRKVCWARAQLRYHGVVCSGKVKSMAKKLPPTHPGEVLLEEFLEPLELSQYRLAKDLQVSPRRINEIVQGKRAIPADTALRVGSYFSTSEQLWLNSQTRYDVEVDRDRLGARALKKSPVYRPVPPRS